MTDSTPPKNDPLLGVAAVLHLVNIAIVTYAMLALWNTVGLVWFGMMLMWTHTMIFSGGWLIKIFKEVAKEES